VNVTAHRTVAPDRRLFAEVHVADYLCARIHVGCWMNLWMDPTKRSNHDFADSNIAADPCYIASNGPTAHPPFAASHQRNRVQ
jgi:hypothetical protein